MTTIADTSFTIDELLAALQGAQPDATGGGVRMEDLVALIGINSTAISRRLRPLLAAGQVECVRVPYQRIDGTWTKVPSYRWVGHEITN